MLNTLLFLLTVTNQKVPPGPSKLFTLHLPSNRAGVPVLDQFDTVWSSPFRRKFYITWYVSGDHLQLPEASAVEKPVGPEFQKRLKSFSIRYYSPNMNVMHQTWVQTIIVNLYMTLNQIKRGSHKPRLHCRHSSKNIRHLTRSFFTLLKCQITHVGGWCKFPTQFKDEDTTLDAWMGSILRNST